MLRQLLIHAGRHSSIRLGSKDGTFTFKLGMQGDVDYNVGDVYMVWSSLTVAMCLGARGQVFGSGANSFCEAAQGG